MYDTHHPPFDIGCENTQIIVEKQGTDLIYRRLSYGKEVNELILLNNEGDIVINPIEPVNLPDPITSYLLIDFKKPVFIRPNDRKKFILLFPWKSVFL
ncbi:MAG: DUF432 domain-containing protein [Methanolobus sp.]